jgi:hypothetical protein
MPVAASNTNDSWRASTGQHDLSQRQLVLLRETPEDMEAEVEELVAPNVNEEWRWGMWGIVRLRSLRRRRDSSAVGRDGVGG